MPETGPAVSVVFTVAQLGYSSLEPSPAALRLLGAPWEHPEALYEWQPGELAEEPLLSSQLDWPLARPSPVQLSRLAGSWVAAALYPASSLLLQQGVTWKASTVTRQLQLAGPPPEQEPRFPKAWVEVKVAQEQGRE